MLEIFQDANWIYAKAEMAYPPDYKFAFQYKNPNIDDKALVYQLWITPYKDKIELIGAIQYVKLDKSISAELFEIITGEKIKEMTYGGNLVKIGFCNPVSCMQSVRYKVTK